MNNKLRPTTGHKTGRFQWVFERFVPHRVLSRGIHSQLSNPARFIHATVSHKQTSDSAMDNEIEN